MLTSIGKAKIVKVAGEDLIGVVETLARRIWRMHYTSIVGEEQVEYMLNKFPLTQALEKIFRGSGECADVGWTLLGLSIAEWSLLWLLLLGVLAVIIAVVARKR